MPPAGVGVDLRVDGLGDVLQPVKDHQERVLQGGRIVSGDGILGIQHGTKHWRQTHRELGGDQVKHPLCRVVPRRHEQVHIVQHPRPGRIAQPPVVEEQIDVGDGWDLLAQSARDRGPRSQQRFGQSGRRVDCHVLIGVGEHAEQSRGPQQVLLGQRLGPGVEHRHRIERLAQRQPAEQLGKPVGHVVPGTVRFTEGQQRRLGRQEPVRQRQESVELVPDPPVVRLRGLHNASCGDLLRRDRPQCRQLIPIDGHSRAGVQEHPGQLVSADAHLIPGHEYPARHLRVVDVGSVGAAEIGEHNLVVDDFKPGVASRDVGVVQYHRRRTAVPAESCR